MTIISLLNKTFYPLKDATLFYGVGESIKDHQAVNVSVYTDQNCVLTLFWSFNNLDFYFNKSYNVSALTPVNVIASNQASYFKIKIENNSGNDMTILHCGSMFVNDAPDIDKETFLTTPLWNNESIANGLTSSSVNITNFKQVDIYGNSSGLSTFIVQVSDDDVLFFDSSYSIICDGNDFHATVNLSAKYMRLWHQSLSNRTVTCFVNAK